MHRFTYRRLQSLRYAFEGLHFITLHHPNFFIHPVFSLVLIATVVFLRGFNERILILILAAVLGLVSEIFNTAIELMTDIFSGGWQARTKRVKDISAGAVLITVVVEIFVAGVLLVSGSY